MVFEENFSKERYDELTNQSVEISLDESLSAAFALGFDETPLASTFRTLGRSDPDEELVDPGQLNEMFPNMEVPFSRPEKLSIASEIANRQRYRQELGQKVSLRPEGAMNSVMTFGAGMMAEALDPLNHLAGLGASVGLAYAFTRGGKAAITGSKLLSKVSPAQFEVGYSAFEGVIGNLAVEPIVAFSSNRDQIDYGLDQIALNTLVGGIAFPVVGGIAKYAGSRIENFFHERGVDFQKFAYNLAMNELKQGRKIEIEPLVRQYAREVSGVNPKGIEIDGIKTYTYSKYIPESGPKSFYSVNVEGKYNAIGTRYGDGIYLSDNPFVANGYSVGISGNKGVIEKFDINTAKLIDLDNKIDEKTKDIFKPVLEKLEENKAKVDTILDRKSGKDIYERIKSGIESGKLTDADLDSINKGLKERGFNGLVYTNDKVLNESTPAHNTMMLFDDSKLSNSKQIEPNRSALPEPDQAEIDSALKQALSDESNAIYEPTTISEYRGKAEQKEPTVSQLRQIEKDIFEELNEIEKLNLLPEEFKGDIELIRESLKNQETNEKGIKAAFNCLLGGGDA